MEKRLVLALALSILILAIWNTLFPPPKPKNEPLSKVHPNVQNIVQPLPSASSELITPQEVKPKISGEDYVFSGEDIVIDRPLYRAIFSTSGGLLRSFQLKNYPEEKIRMEDIEKAMKFSTDQKLKKKLELLKERLPLTTGIEMVSLSSNLEALFPLSIHWQERNLDLNYSLYAVDKKDKTLTFSFCTGDNLKIVRSYSFREDTYLIDVEIRLINESQKTFPSSPLVIRYGPDLGLSTNPFGKGDPYYRGLVLVKEAARERVIREPFGRAKRGNAMAQNYPEALWAGLENKYFAAIFLPPAEPHSLWLEKDSSGYFNLGLKLQMPELKPEAVLIKNFSLYLGPKQKETLIAVGAGLEKSIDYGVISSMLKIPEILKFFYGITRNWGLAIIILTILTKIILWPLTQKSFRSMEEMQRLQPYLKELRLKYKDDPRRMNKELMELYREHHVNPMSGCLPMLLQMPIFIALFTTLRNTIELREASFLWIKDLSQPDTIFYMAGIPINPLPLVMGLSMFWQQKISTTDPEQARMMVFMPVIFTVMFYNFSSGLVLYWFLQNILTIGHQYGMKLAKKRNGKK